MITNKSFTTVIVTPTKTGTKSMESALKSQGWEVFMPRHASVIPEAYKYNGLKVFLTIRNPYSRLVSMYRFGIVTNHSYLLRMGMLGFDSFCENWVRSLKTHKPHDWAMTYSNYLDALLRQGYMGTRVLKIEKGTAAALKAVGAAPVERHVNKSHDRPTSPTVYWTKANLKVVGPAVQEDCERFGYTFNEPA